MPITIRIEQYIKKPIENFINLREYISKLRKNYDDYKKISYSEVFYLMLITGNLRIQ